MRACSLRVALFREVSEKSVISYQLHMNRGNEKLTFKALKIQVVSSDKQSSAIRETWYIARFESLITSTHSQISFRCAKIWFSKSSATILSFNNFKVGVQRSCEVKPYNWEGCPLLHHSSNDLTASSDLIAAWRSFSMTTDTALWWVL